MDKLFLKYADHVEFFTVYIREAHPTDGWRMSWNDQFGIKTAQPTSNAQRAEIAKQCCEQLQLLSPMLLDQIDDKVATDYAAFPDRLYLIDPQGRVAYKGGRGPFGYRPGEMEQVLIMMLMDQAPVAQQ